MFQTVGVATIGQRVKTLRKARRLSQPELARLVGISQPSLANIESDKTKKLRGETLAGLCRVLHVAPDALIGRRRVPSEESLLHEAELIGLWRALTGENQEHMLAIARALATKPGRRPPVTSEAEDPAPAEAETRITTEHGPLTER